MTDAMIRMTTMALINSNCHVYDDNRSDTKNANTLNNIFKIQTPVFVQLYWRFYKPQNVEHC